MIRKKRNWGEIVNTALIRFLSNIYISNIKLPCYSVMEQLDLVIKKALFGTLNSSMFVSDCSLIFAPKPLLKQSRRRKFLRNRINFSLCFKSVNKIFTYLNNPQYNFMYTNFKILQNFSHSNCTF